MRKSALLAAMILMTGLVIVFFACKKEYSYEGGDSDIFAHGSLRDDFDNCFVAAVNGNYYNGIAATETNFVNVTLHITHPGTYQIRTETSNGFQFTSSGTIADTGIQVIKMTASGTPTSIEETDFTLQFDGSVCQLRVHVSDSSSLHGHPVDIYRDTAWQFDCQNRRYFGFATRGSYSKAFYDTYTDTTVLIEDSRPQAMAVYRSQLKL